MLADTHAHLYWESYKEDLDEVIKRAKKAHIGLIINVGVDLEKSAEALKQVEESLGNISNLETFSTIGIHPHEASKYSTNPGESIRNDIDKLEAIYDANPKKVIGVGECGLDFLFESNPDFIPTSMTEQQIKDLQRDLFQAQIDLAKKLKLPLTVHIRDDRSQNPLNTECWDEALEMLKDSFGILHCYSGLDETTQKALEMDFLFSFAANITYPKNEYLREAIKIIPLDRIVLETDSPFLAPQSSRGKRNEPSSVLESAQLIAELKGVELAEVESKTTQNVKRLIKLNL